jgi:hypothetical protein
VVGAAVVVPATASSAAPGYTFSAQKLPASVRERMIGVSWHRGCPVGLDGLRYLRIRHHGFDGRLHTGEMVVGAGSVEAVRRVFRTLFSARFPIRRMHLVDDYGGSDFDSIEADNTSAFNCRPATGSSRWSEHAYGRAIDINPIENPYVYANRTTSHRASRPYLDRSRYRRGMATPRGVLVRAFKSAGWGWGGDWPYPRDYQHFSASSR